MGRKRKVPRSFKLPQWYEYTSDTTDSDNEGPIFVPQIEPTEPIPESPEVSDNEIPQSPERISDNEILERISDNEEIPDCLLYTSPSPRDS